MVTRLTGETANTEAPSWIWDMTMFQNRVMPDRIKRGLPVIVSGGTSDIGCEEAAITAQVMGAALPA